MGVKSDSVYVDYLRNVRVKNVRVEDGSDTKLKQLVKGVWLDLGEEGYGIQMSAGDDIVINTKDDMRLKIGGTAKFSMAWTGSTFYHKLTVDGDLLPRSDNAYNCGDDEHRWALVRAVTVTTGDLGFDDRACPVCNRRFREGDSIVLKVWRVDGDKVLTVPVHVECNPHELGPRAQRAEGGADPRGEVVVLDQEVVDEDTMLLTVALPDGSRGVVEVPPDADEGEVEEAIRRYLALHERMMEEERRRVEEGLKKVKRDWRGFRVEVG